MEQIKEDNYDEYSTTKTYSLKIKNVKKVDKVAKEKEINKSQALNVIIEDY